MRSQGAHLGIFKKATEPGGLGTKVPGGVQWQSHPVFFVLRISTEIAKSFTSKDLADTFPRQIACLEHLQETS